MRRLGLERDVVDPHVYRRTVERFREAGIIMPTFAQLADPSTIPSGIAAEVRGVEPDAPHPRNLFRAHWYNGWGSPDPLALPEHVVLPPELTGVGSPIVVLLGDRFPMIHSHKVIAAYGCLAPRIVTGQFDPTSQRAVWPSTGNYCRGGVAISRIMQSHGVAVLPEGMSQERFDWLMAWVADPRTSSARPVRNPMSRRSTTSAPSLTATPTRSSSTSSPSSGTTSATTR